MSESKVESEGIQALKEITLKLIEREDRDVHIPIALIGVVFKELAPIILANILKEKKQE